MIEVGDGAGFVQVGLGIRFQGHQMGVWHLDRNGPFQLLVACQVDQAEAAFAQYPLHLIAADLLRDMRFRSGRMRTVLP